MIGAMEVVFLLGYVLVPALFFYVLYWVVRVAVRSALRDVAGDPPSAH